MSIEEREPLSPPPAPEAGPPEPLLHKSIIGLPYYWTGRDGQLRCRFRGVVFAVDRDDYKVHELRKLAIQVEANMLRRLADEQFKRKPDGRKRTPLPYPRSGRLDSGGPFRE